MRRLVWTSIVALMLTTGSVTAHHGYAEYDRNAAATLEGTVTQVRWANPHVVLTLEIQNGGEYSVEWDAASLLSRQGVRTASVQEGDHLVITGAINKNPEKRILTLLREIRRPADGWRWTNPARFR